MIGQMRDRIKELRRVPARELVPNPRNWRRHPEGQRAAMKGVLAEVGYADALLVRETPGGLMILDGHLRAETTPESLVPVLVTDLSEEEGDKLLAVLDPLAAMAETDGAALRQLLESVQSEDAEVRALLARLQEQAVKAEGPRAGQTDPDEVPPVPAKAVTQPGDMWVLGAHRLLCGDSTKAEQVERLMEGARAALVYTDPPYGVGYDGGTKVREKLRGDGDVLLYDPACKMAARFSDAEAALYLWHAGVKGIAAAAAAAAAGYQIRCELVWNKNQAQFGALSAQYKQKHEPAYYCFKRGKAPRWFGPTNEVTVWDCARAPANDFHPTQKPVELGVRAIGNSSEAGDLILDLFAGSGSTLIAAEQVGRRCYALEIEPRYVDVAVKRWETFTGQKAERIPAEGQRAAPPRRKARAPR